MINDKSEKKIIILGGGVNQLQLITKAKELGYFVIVCDYNEYPPAYEICDDFRQISSSDVAKIKKLAIEENVDGIIANTEAIMLNLAQLTEELNLPGNTESAISYFSSKSNFRSMQKELGLFTPNSYECASFNDFLNLNKQLDYPIIIKPSESSGSRGTTIIKEEMELTYIEQRFNECMYFSRNNKVVIEEFVEMDNYENFEIEFFVDHGEILWNGMILTLRNPDMPFIPQTYIYPIICTKNQKQEIQEVIKKIIKYSQVTFGEFNAEMYYSKGRLFIVEINPRQGGNRIPDFINLSSGIDFSRLLVAGACDDDTYWDKIHDIKYDTRFITTHVILPIESGYFERIDIPDYLHKYIIELKVNVKKGTEVNATRNATSEIGMVVFEFTSKKQQEIISRNLYKEIKVIINNY